MVIRKTVAALVAAMSISTAQAGGGGIGGGATEWTQLANNAELVAIYSSEIQQVAQQLQMIQNMVQNTNQLPIQMWSSVESQLVSLVNAITSVNGVVNATEDALAMTQQQFGNGGILSNHENRLRSWNQGVNNQIGTALQNMGMNAGQFRTRQQALSQIQSASQSATGRMQVLQAGNQIAGLMVNEMQSLHGTIISAEQARLNAIAVESNRKHQERQALEKFMKAPVKGGF